MDLGIKGKNVVVTGASQGTGASIAYRFLEEGANVLLVSRGSDQLFKTESQYQAEFGKDRVEATICDCTNKQSLQKLGENIQQFLSCVDIVVANVGDGRSVPDPLPDEEQWDKTWGKNFESTLLTTRTFLPMLEETKGTFLFVSSITGLEAIGAPVDYSTAKAAVLALAKNMARKLATQVRVNVLAPGNIYFPGSSWDEKIKQDPERVKKIIETTVPMKRFGTPEEMADAAVFLCSERAKFITGSVLTVDGGQTVGVC
jgi:3-oxoacyl-[acyl-carrier protein] reductase